MDKAEYRVMLDQITSLVEDGDFSSALPIVEGIDWRRVKSVRTLCMVSEIYEENGRLADSYKVLRIAYKRASISKTVLYRLAETSAKLGNYKEAVTYYREFEEVSPMDSSKYILKYEIYKAKGAPIETLIEILERYKEREYTEQWAYELAKLYSEAGMKEACVEACDDLILWFSEGAYVKGAMELKKKYTTLSASQAKKYQDLASYKTPEEEKIEAERQASEKAANRKASEESVDFEASILANTDVALSSVSVSEITAVEQKTPVEQAVQRDPVHMQNQLADSIRAVFSGIKGNSEKYEESDVEEEDDVKIYNPTETDMSGYEIKELEPESVSDDLEEEVDEKTDTVTAVVEETDGEQIAGQMSFTDFEKPQEFDLEALIAETTSALAQEVASGEFHMTDEALATEGEDVAQEAAEEEAARIAAEEEAARIAAEEEAARIAAEEEAARIAAEEEAARIAAEEEAARIAAEEEAARIAAEEEAARIAAEEEAARIAAEEEEARKVAEEVARATEKEVNLQDKETDESLGLTREFNFNEELKRTVSQNAAESSAEELTIDKVDLEDLERLLQESIMNKEPSQQEESAETEDILEELSLLEEEKRFKYVPVEPRELTEKEKGIFAYFTKIPGMSQQITETLCDVHNNAGDKTSRSGNFLIIGRQGSGKTKLYECMVLAICNDLEIKAAKMAKIIGRDLNKKDPVAIVSKLSGGFLVIEGAGELNDETVAKLSQAMEFRTDSLVVVLEDEKEDLFAMLDRYPELSEKFTSSIKIPVFTNDELVTFAKMYAGENGYKMDEMGILALYTKISENQKNTEPVTVGKVKDIMDTAFERANRGTRKLGRRFVKNAVDDDLILLREKDFD